jgi:heavy metal sensor kinase
MNTKGLKFRLIVWYAGLLTGCFLFLGGACYVLLQGYMVGALKQSLLRRGRQIGQLVVSESERQGTAGAGSEIESRYAPGLNERFVRVSRKDGDILYTSSPPVSHSFLPSTLPAPLWPAGAEEMRRLPLGNRREILVMSHVVELPGDGRYLIETGAPMDEVQADLRQWLTLLAIGLPLITLIAIGGGFFLVNRALSPVDRIAMSAERISSQNLSERLPDPKTGDELARLSLALNRMLERLDQALQHSRRFVADASHELRTPLTVLRGELESLLQESRQGPEWRERLGSALEEVERLTNIVEGLFAISRLDAGEAQAEWVRFDLAQMASSTADQMSLLAEDKGIRITCGAGKGIWVEGDRARMKQVVVNLLDNAIKYTPQGGSIGLTVSTHGGKAILEVADNGIGIPAEALPRVFERFFRVDKVRSRDPGGAGLGLSIVKSICAAHHGQVEAISTPGSGSIFRVELPLPSTPVNNGKQESALA